MRIKQCQHELVVELHDGWLVGFGAQHLECEIECAIRPSLRKTIEIHQCCPRTRRLIAPAQALQRPPHRRQFGDRHGVEKDFDIVRCRQFRRGRNEGEHVSVFGRTHSCRTPRQDAGPSLRPARYLPLVQHGAHPVQASPATRFREASGNTWSRVSGASGMLAGAAGSIHTITSISAFGATSPVTSISYSAART